MNRVSFLIFTCIISVLLSIIITINIVYPTSHINLHGDTYDFKKYKDAINVLHYNNLYNFTSLFDLEPTLSNNRLDNVRIGYASLVSILGIVLIVTFLVIISAKINSGFFTFFENVFMCIIVIVVLIMGILIISKNIQLKTNSDVIQHNMTTQCFTTICNTYPGNYDIINKTNVQIYTLYYYADYTLFDTYNCKNIIYQRSYDKYEDALNFAKTGYTLYEGTQISFIKNTTFKSNINCTKDIFINDNDVKINMCPYKSIKVNYYDGFYQYYTNQKRIIVNKMISTGLFVISITLGIYLIIKAIVYSVIFYRRLMGTD